MLQQVFWTLVVRAFLLAASLLTSIITARALGPEGRGIFFYWTTLAALIMQFGNLGLHSSNTYYLAKGKATLATLMANSLWVSVIAGIVLGGGLIALAWYQKGGLEMTWPFLFPVLFMAPAGLYFLLGTNLLVALDRIGEYNAFEFTKQYLVLGSLLLSAWLWQTPTAFITAVALCSVVMCLPLFWRIRALGTSGGASFSVFYNGFGYAMRAYLVSLFAFLVLRLNTVLLERYADPDSFGIWTIAAQLFEVLIIVPNTIALIFLPKIIRTSDPYRMVQIQMKIVFCIMLAICVVVVLLAQDLIVLFYGETFIGAYDMLLWALPGAVCLGLISILSQYMAVMCIPIALIWIWVLAVIMEILLTVWLAPEYGGKGAMLAMSSTYLVVLILAWLLIIYKKDIWRHKDTTQAHLQ